MILQVLGWLAVADVLAAAVIGGLVYLIGRRTARPVPPGSAIALAVFLGLPAVLLYAAAWLLLALSR